MLFLSLLKIDTQIGNKELGQLIHNKDTGLDDINKKVIDDNIEPEPRSGRQEYLENILNKYL